MTDPYFPGQTPDHRTDHAVPMSRRVALLALLPALLLAGCSGTPAQPATDYGKAETTAALAFISSAPTFAGTRGQGGLEFVKAYCGNVAQKGVKATNRDDLLVYDSATVADQEKAAALYCPVTMKVAG